MVEVAHNDIWLGIHFVLRNASAPWAYITGELTGQACRTGLENRGSFLRWGAGPQLSAIKNTY